MELEWLDIRVRLRSMQKVELLHIILLEMRFLCI